MKTNEFEQKATERTETQSRVFVNVGGIALTPALFRRARGNHRQSVRQLSAFVLSSNGMRFFLSRRERAGVRVTGLQEP